MLRGVAVFPPAALRAGGRGQWIPGRGCCRTTSSLTVELRVNEAAAPEGRATAAALPQTSPLEDGGPDRRARPDRQLQTLRGGAGTLEFTTATGLRYRRAPTPATPAAPDLDDPLIATAVAHADLRAARQAVDQARMDTLNAADQQRLEATGRIAPAAAGRLPADEFDGQDRAWRHTLNTPGAVNGGVAARAQAAVHLDPPF